MKFSLFFFESSDTGCSSHLGAYDHVFQAAAYADSNGFDAIWTPERHFHPFGGIYANPAVLSAALAAKTQFVRIRAGSVVLPNHHPVRVAEDWSIVDNLSGGRVDISFTKGWNQTEFIFHPDTPSMDHDRLIETVEIILSLWRGNPHPFPTQSGEMRAIQHHPHPIQPVLTPWISTFDPRLFEEAGRRGWHILTALLLQSVDELADKISIYKAARESAGRDPDGGEVTLMLHTYIDETEADVEAQVAGPFMRYLDSSINLWAQKESQLSSLPRDKILQYAYKRYRNTATLFGTSARCIPFINALGDIGVTEIAGLLDFGIDIDPMMRSLDRLNTIRQTINSL